MINKIDYSEVVAVTGDDEMRLDRLVKALDIEKHLASRKAQHLLMVNWDGGLDKLLTYLTVNNGVSIVAVIEPIKRPCQNLAIKIAARQSDAMKDQAVLLDGSH